MHSAWQMRAHLRTARTGRCSALPAAALTRIFPPMPTIPGRIQLRFVQSQVSVCPVGALITQGLREKDPQLGRHESEMPRPQLRLQYEVHRHGEVTVKARQPAGGRPLCCAAACLPKPSTVRICRNMSIKVETKKAAALENRGRMPCRWKSTANLPIRKMAA